MRTTSLILAGLLLSFSLSAQVTLTQSSYPASVIGTDSLKTTVAASVFPALPAVANGSWDMSTITDSLPVIFAYRVPSAPHPFADSNWYGFVGFGYQGNLQSGVTSSGVLQYGINIVKKEFSLYFLTAGPFDSFIINSQNMVFSAPRVKIAFPATYHSSWSSQYNADLNFQLTFLMNGDTLSPGIVRSYYTEKDTVTGWGRMRVKDATGSPSEYQNVLQVQTTIVRTDSFFIKGAPFPPAHLTMFSVTQGQKDTIYEQSYYRAQELTPLAHVRFHDAAFTQPYKATTHIQRLYPSSVPGVSGVPEIQIFPNPSSDRRFTIQRPLITGSWSYELTNVAGQSLLSGSLPGTNTIVSIPESVVPGTYYLRLLNDNKPVSQSKLQVNK